MQFKKKQTGSGGNIYTGYLGSSAWILLVNLLFYQGLFKKEKISWIVVILGVLGVLLPVLYSFDLTNNALTKQQVIRFYMGDESGVTYPYLSYGELISRTGAWLSILIIIFTFVRAKTKRWHVKCQLKKEFNTRTPLIHRLTMQRD
jgi:hypothetical protein